MSHVCIPPRCPPTPVSESTPRDWAEYAVWIVSYGRPERYHEQRFTLPDGRELKALQGDTIEDVLVRLEQTR